MICICILTPSWILACVFHILEKGCQLPTNSNHILNIYSHQATHRLVSYGGGRVIFLYISNTFNRVWYKGQCSSLQLSVCWRTSGIYDHPCPVFTLHHRPTIFISYLLLCRLYYFSYSFSSMVKVHQHKTTKTVISHKQDSLRVQAFRQPGLKTSHNCPL